ncbi:FAD-dependent oxidoreductase [Agrobacterium pusense]|uniref:FAD-dependent oxidoreductase n=1 Tax=Agrobacterium pusense TaxID=648995 RepID=UPI0028970C6E|nr:FAD-dependent oxidoreductase [Agrobacterium pusense]
MKYDILVVGAGFAGACYARTLAEANYKVLVIDQRPHVGGNAFDFIDENGIRRHQYGPHLFHTNNEKVVEWVSKFGAWVPYLHKVRAKLSDDTFVPLPINLETINVFFGLKLETEEQVRAHLGSIALKIKNPQNAAEHLYSTIGKDLTDIFFRRYTKKMWSLDLEDMSVDVVKRIPLRFDRSELYFPNDKIQIVPRDGYTSIFQEIFRHKNIYLQLNEEFSKDSEGSFTHIFNSMPIDLYFDYEFGELPYRSIKFHHETSNMDLAQSWSVTNFTDDGPLTRQTAWHLLPHHHYLDTGRFTYTTEEPCDYRDNDFERYYPVKSADGRFDKVYQHYKDKAAQLAHMTFIGRCGTYQYLDMHQVINQSLAGAHHWLRANSKITS